MRVGTYASLTLLLSWRMARNFGQSLLCQRHWSTWFLAGLTFTTPMNMKITQPREKSYVCFWMSCNVSKIISICFQHVFKIHCKVDSRPSMLASFWFHFCCLFRATPQTLGGTFRLYFKLSGFVADVMNDSVSLQLQTDTNFFHGVVETGVFLETVCFLICWISTIVILMACS